MDGRNCTANARLQEQMYCPSDAVETFQNTMGKQIWLENALLLASPGIMGVLVGIGGYGRRYRHHPFTRFIFLGANTLFLPIISYSPMLSPHSATDPMITLTYTTIV